MAPNLQQRSLPIRRRAANCLGALAHRSHEDWSMCGGGCWRNIPDILIINFLLLGCDQVVMGIPPWARSPSKVWSMACHRVAWHRVSNTSFFSSNSMNGPVTGTGRSRWCWSTRILLHGYEVSHSSLQIPTSWHCWQLLQFHRDLKDSGPDSLSKCWIDDSSPCPQSTGSCINQSNRSCNIVHLCLLFETLYWINYSKL